MSSHRGIPLWLIPVWCLVASAAIAQNAPEKALKYHEALLKRPHNAALFDRFFGAWLDEQPIEALDAFLKARADSGGGQNWTVLAIYQLRRGNEEDALSALAKGIEAVPDDPALPVARAKLRLRRLEFEGARSDLSRVAAGKDEVLALEAAKLTGKAWLREGKTEEAIKAWDAVLAAHPGDEDLLEDLVETAATESETAQALVYAGKLIEVSRDPYQKTLRMLRRGDLLAQAGKNDEAVEAYAGTLNQVGEGSWLEREVLAQIEKVFRKQDRMDDLAKEMKKLAETYPQRLLIQRQLAKLEAAQGEIDAAIGRFREVLKRLPGEREVRDEFVRMLVDGERLDEAVAELEKLIELTPADSGLYLEVAGLRSRQRNADAVLAALKKAHELLGKDEGNGLRIAGLMLQYGLPEPGESLLKELVGPASMEALATHYGRTGRKTEAIELLKKAGAGDDVDTLLRTCGVISGMGETATAFEILSARAEKFSSEPRFLSALAQSALATNKPAEAVPQVLKLVRLAKQSGELAESIGLASRVIAAAEKVFDVRTTLAAQTARTSAETCLLASLAEIGGDFVEVGNLLELNPDPLVIRFHAALLDRRGDFEKAIAVVSRLADTEEGRKAGYFKDLSELQQRAGRNIEALATVERWKLAAPGDKTAWVVGSRMLRESGRPEEAVKMARQAVGRFEGDADLAASLAALHDEAGQWPDAEAIYWRLYDQGQSPADQARWAAQLARLAQRTGKIADLEEKLRERMRGNRRSIGPILALAELARATENDDKRRDLLLEALRLQPKDIDLRLQVATLEEQAGNPDRTLALLQEALAFDADNRVRAALAQAYLRLGQPVKGLRELRLLSGKTAFDARSAESAATSLAGAKLYAEAIDLLRAELPDGGDWRSRYLLAVLLEEDGRETEALPVFLDLLQPKEAIPALAPPAGPGSNFRYPYPESVMAMFRLISASQSAYMHRNPESAYSMGASATGTFSLPKTPEDVRQFALVHLCRLAKMEPGEVSESIRKQVQAAGIDNMDFISDLPATRPRGVPDLSGLLEKHPTQPGLLETMLVYAGNNSRRGQGIDRQLILRILEHPEKLSLLSRFTAWSVAAAGTRPEDPAWASMFAAARECIAAGTSVNQRLTALLRGQGDCPESQRQAVKQLLLDDLAATTKAHPENAHNGFALSVLSIAGTPETWLVEMNATIRESRKPGAPVAPARAHAGGLTQWPIMRRGNVPPGAQESLFTAPKLETLPIRAIPQQVHGQLSDVLGKPQEAAFSVNELMRLSDQIESPLMRAWLAVAAGDKETIATALAVVPPPEEAADFELLRALVFIRAHQIEAIATLIKARALAGSNREQVAAINITLMAAASLMTPEERAPLADELQAAILQCRQFQGGQGASMLSAQARELGFADLAKRIAPTGQGAGNNRGTAAKGPAAIAAARRLPPQSQNRQPAAFDNVRKLVAGKKFEAAAREVLQTIRSQDAGTLKAYYDQELPKIAAILGAEGQAKLLELVDPGDSKSLLKRLEYADVCNALGKHDFAAKTLEAVAKDRPDDAAIATRLLLTPSAYRSERLVELMTQACRWEGFVTEVSAFAIRLGKRKDNRVSLDFFEIVTRWLETVDPAEISAANLTWVSFYGKQFFLGDCTSGLPSLFSDDKGKDANRELIDRRTALGGRLTRAMMRHTGCAEEGFRLLAGAKAWKIEPPAMDGFARAVLLATAGSRSPRDAGLPFFTMDRGKGITETSLSLPEFSSASWLVRRIKEVKSPDEIFSAEFNASLRQRDPAAGDFLATLSRDLTGQDLAALWNSEVVTARGSRLAQVLRPLMVQRIALAPGSSKFLAEQISEMLPVSAVSRYGNGDSEETAILFAAALAAAAAAGPAEMDAVARAVTRAVFGEWAPDFAAEAAQQAILARVKFMDSLCRLRVDEPAVMVPMQAAFFQIGIPLGVSDTAATMPFTNLRFTTVDEAEAFLESLGWLANVDRWEPYLTLTYRQESKDGEETGILEPKLLLVSALQSFRHDRNMAEDLIQRLKDRKAGRFGSLMVAAALSSGAERSAIAGQAFTEFSADLAKLPAPRADRFSLLLPWLPDDVRATLPENLRSKHPPRAEGMPGPKP